MRSAAAAHAAAVRGSATSNHSIPHGRFRIHKTSGNPQQTNSAPSRIKPAASNWRPNLGKLAPCPPCDMVAIVAEKLDKALPS
jgi:hypothetical protein